MQGPFFWEHGSPLSRRALLRNICRGALVAGLPACFRQSAEAHAEVVQSATTSNAAREDAARAIPFSALNDEARRKADFVVENVSIFRRLPTQVFSCDPRLYLFLLNHPEVLVAVWQALGISNVSIQKIDTDTYSASENGGTESTISYLHRSDQLHLVHAEGVYEGPLFKRRVRGKCLFLLKTGYLHQSDGRDYVANRLDAFIHLDRMGAEIVAKTFQPIVGKTADENFAETSSFVGKLSYTAESNHHKLVQLAARMNTLEPSLRKAFLNVTADVAKKAEMREAVLTADADNKPRKKSDESETPNRR